MKLYSNLYVLRELKTYDALIASFQLRYQVYKDFPRLTAENYKTLQMNINKHDIVSRHFGLYKQTDFAEEMIGCMRITGASPDAFAVSALQQLKNQYPFLPTEPPTAFPFQSYFPDAESILNISLETDKEQVCECGRLSILPSYRAIGLAQFVINAAGIVFHADPKWQVAVVATKIIYKRLYERNGLDWKATEKGFASDPLHFMLGERAKHALRYPKLSEQIQSFQESGCFYYEEAVKSADAALVLTA